MHAAALIAWVTAAVAGGWRSDGTSVFPGTTPPPVWRLEEAAWTRPTEGWGNGTPVRLGDLVCVTEEPVTLLCLDAATGAVRWRAAHPVAEALDGPTAEVVRAEIARAEAAVAKLDAARREHSALQREARRGGADPALSTRLAAASAELDRLKAEVDAGRRYLTQPDKELIGYASATPLAHGDALYVSWGNGVVAKRRADGSAAWARWLGPPPTPMRGYEVGQTASPVLVDGVLVVGSGHLTGLDPATGAVLWTGPEYRDYGTPGVAMVDGIGVVLTPDGRLVRARDGRVLQEGLGDVLYVGPTVVGTRAWYVGGATPEHGSGAKSSRAVALQLVREGDAVRAVTRWTRELRTTALPYAPAVVHGGLIYVSTKRGELHVLRDEDGAEVYVQDLRDRMLSDVMPCPSVAGDRLWLGAANGRVVSIALGDRFALLDAFELGEATRASPLFEGGSVFLRTEARVVRIGR